MSFKMHYISDYLFLTLYYFFYFFSLIFFIIVFFFHVGPAWYLTIKEECGVVEGKRKKNKAEKVEIKNKKNR
jgi:hypothetical protein